MADSSSGLSLVRSYMVSTARCSSTANSPSTRQSVTNFSTSHQCYHKEQRLKSLSSSSSSSMNGCQLSITHTTTSTPVELIETRTLQPVSNHADALERLCSAVFDELTRPDPPPFSSGIIRLQVPIEQEIEAVDWLHSQNQILPRVFFSGRRRHNSSNFLINYCNGNDNGSAGSHSSGKETEVVSVAGIGAAVYFRRSKPLSPDDWKSIKRFLSKRCPLIRAYGAIRFDAESKVSDEWSAFGSFYFVVPQVEFDELEGSSLLAANIAWDSTLSHPWRRAAEALHAILRQVNSCIIKLQKDIMGAGTNNNVLHIPDEEYWHSAVRRALSTIRSNSELSKVVLARSSRVLTTVDIDPVAWIACLQAEGANAYQFCLQPPDAPAFIGNSPEQLFRRKELDISSEALAATRARSGSEALDLEIEADLLSNPKDHLEFTIVREIIRRKLEAVCSSVIVDPEKAVRKLPRVQHLYALLKGRLKSEADEFEILSSLHPTPAVCGYPTEEARLLIAETERFDRGMYAGPVGWIGGEETEFAVGIRSALVKQGVGALIYAGTGIVEGSCPSSEWDELELKISQYAKLFGAEVLSPSRLRSPLIK